MPNIRKKQTHLKHCSVFIQVYPIMYIYQGIVDVNRRYSVIKGQFQFKRKHLSLLQENLTIIFSFFFFFMLCFFFFPGTPGLLNRSIIY